MTTLKYVIIIVLLVASIDQGLLKPLKVVPGIDYGAYILHSTVVNIN